MGAPYEVARDGHAHAPSRSSESASCAPRPDTLPLLGLTADRLPPVVGEREQVGDGCVVGRARSVIVAPGRGPPSELSPPQPKRRTLEDRRGAMLRSVVSVLTTCALLVVLPPLPVQLS
jgi:hypothetical protein